MATRHADGRNSIKHGSGRVAGLARWLEKQPDNPDFDTLCCELKSDGEWSRVQTWPRDQVHALLAELIDSLCQEYVDELGAYTTFRCAWWASETDRYWITRELRYQPNMGEGEPGQVFAGDLQSANIQTQRHLEKMASVHVGGFQSAMTALKLTTETLRDECQELREENRQLRARVAELEGENAQLHTQAEQAADLAESLVQKAESDDKESNVISLITKSLTGPPAAAK